MKKSNAMDDRFEKYGARLFKAVGHPDQQEPAIARRYATVTTAGREQERQAHGGADCSSPSGHVGDSTRFYA